MNRVQAICILCTVGIFAGLFFLLQAKRDSANDSPSQQILASQAKDTIKVSGFAQYSHDGKRWFQWKQTTDFDPGLHIRSRSYNPAYLTLSDESVVRLNPSSEIELKELDANANIVVIKTIRGAVDFNVNPEVTWKKFDVMLGSSVASAKGTVFRCEHEDGKSKISTAEGTVWVTNSTDPETSVLMSGAGIELHEGEQGTTKAMIDVERKMMRDLMQFALIHRPSVDSDAADVRSVSEKIRDRLTNLIDAGMRGDQEALKDGLAEGGSAEAQFDSLWRIARTNIDTDGVSLQPLLSDVRIVQSGSFARVSAVASFEYSTGRSFEGNKIPPLAVTSTWEEVDGQWKVFSVDWRRR